jgi:DNA-cytosine methyltransferase
MKYLSVCSGIEAATVAWHHMGWKPVGFSEIEKFPSQVLAHHYPDVTNYGDMTKYKEWQLNDSIGLLVGGTPCQSFSVAGLRKGLNDPRGNLMLTFLGIADHFKPRWIVWENVPGVISDKTNALENLLDGLEELGYIVDCDILDAQFHGVAQRRRRIFVCGQHRDDLIAQRTDTSALTIAQCLQEILHSILIEQLKALGKEPQNLDLAHLSRDGMMRRMKLFGMLGEANNWKLLRKNLIEAYLRYQQGQKKSDAPLGGKEKEHILADQLTDFQMESQFTLTEQLLKSTLDDAYEVMKLFTTLTTTNLITQSQIYMCSKAVLNIAKLIALLNQSSPSYWSAGLSTLICLKEYTNYARQTSSDLFAEMEWIQAWADFIKQAESASDFIGSVGISSFGEIYAISKSLSGNPAPSREKREEVAGTIGKCASDGGDLSTTVTSKWQKLSWGPAGSISELGNSVMVNRQAFVPSAQPIAYNITFCDANGRRKDRPNGGLYVNETEVSSTLTKTGIGTNAVQPIGFEANMSLQQPSIGGVYQTLTRRTHASVLEPASMAVRRLTPTECERLQGFPDGYTDIQPNGKQTPDGPRYKALGNSMAVPVMRWIGERIQMVEEI